MTDAERMCLQLAARGQASEALASQFGGDNAVTDLFASARKKLMATTTMEALARALKLGLIE
ncbi:hypothetical protein [Hoeflea sp.]|uniref:hypothetical protein n=1 Tax=Hoeflea sp. TaxID=1940281 RepID=UPI00198C2A8B|nr:hypothetical protein [Hoeflea sp.]MBC7281784.1 hypothetical protein [Hoeflea sp.]